MLFAFAAAIFHDWPRTRRPAEQWNIGVGRAICTSVAALLALAFQVVVTGAELVDLRPTSQTGGNRQVKTVVEVEGKLKLNADGQEVKHLPLKVRADLQYVERDLAQTKQWSEVRLVRSYQTAQATIRLRDSDLASNLRGDRRLVVVESSPQGAIHFSPVGPLTREELDLVEAPGSGLALEALLPPRAQKTGGQWPLPDATAVRLLGLEVVNQHDVVCTLESVQDNLAIVSLAGKVAGAVGGVSSDIELKGKLNFDLRKRAITWLTLAYKENRAIGHSQPGFEVLTTLRMICAPTQPAVELSDAALAGLPLKADSGQTLIDLKSEAGRFQLTHDRRWRVLTERHDGTILRLVDRGDLIAQCNLSSLAALPKGQQLTLEGFQDDVKRTLGKNLEQVIEAGQEASEGGIQIFRVVVAGNASELPIQWMYYHLSDDHGHRVAIVFTIEASLVERFAHIDREMVSGLRFLSDNQPTLAPANGGRTAQAAGGVETNR